MKTFCYLIVSLFFLAPVGCGGSTGEMKAPAGNELEQFLAENPEINNSEEVDDTANRE